MKLVVQRVKYAKVSVGNELISEINQGFLVFIGFSNNDIDTNFDKIVNKLINLRIFEDEENKMNLSLKDINGEILLISQFTLYAKLNGLRPSFSDALNYDSAEKLYIKFYELLKNSYKNVKKGVFGAKMDIELLNNGPVTIIVDDKEIWYE
ncbi:MAG TPA: D-aminoacyl-tRNA deacylase [Bacilli bacterium]|nr:D-aminoacyl-tRNA deacylase [Bacilli bacterium]